MKTGKLKSIYINLIENGFILTVNWEDPKKKDRYDEISKEYFCKDKEAVIARINEVT